MILWGRGSEGEFTLRPPTLTSFSLKAAGEGGRAGGACMWHILRLPLTIWARRYIWAWLAVRAGEVAFPRSTACWAMPEAAAEFTL